MQIQSMAAHDEMEVNQRLLNPQPKKIPHVGIATGPGAWGRALGHRETSTMAIISGETLHRFVETSEHCQQTQQSLLHWGSVRNTADIYRKIAVPGAGGGGLRHLIARLTRTWPLAGQRSQSEPPKKTIVIVLSKIAACDYLALQIHAVCLLATAYMPPFTIRAQIAARQTGDSRLAFRKIRAARIVSPLPSTHRWSRSGAEISSPTPAPSDA